MANRHDNDVLVVSDDDSDVDERGTAEDPISLSDDEAGLAVNEDILIRKLNEKRKGDSANHEVPRASAKRAVAVAPNNQLDMDEDDGEEGTKIFACRNAFGLSSFEVVDDDNVVVVLGSGEDPWTRMDEDQYEGAKAVVFFQLQANLFHLTHIWTSERGAFQAREGVLPMWPRMKNDDDSSFVDWMNSNSEGEGGEDWMPILLKTFKIVGGTVDILEVAQVVRKRNGKWEVKAEKEIDVDQLFANRQGIDESLTDHIYALTTARALF